MPVLNGFFGKILLFGFLFNCVLWIFSAFQVDPQVQVGVSLTDWTSWFNLSPFNLMFATGTAAVIGVAALLLRQGTYALYAMLIAGITMIIGPIQNFIMAIPNTLSLLIPASTNPNPALFAENPILIVIRLIFAFAAYWFIFGLVIQRDI